MTDSKTTRRSRIVTGVILATLAIALIVYREPLFMWFTGKPMGGESGAATAVQAGSLSLRARLDPDPPRTSGNALLLEITDSAGHPVEGAKVDVAYDMPAMGAMPEMKGTARVAAERAGQYRAAFDLPMAGSWTLKVSVAAPAGSVSQDFTLTVGTAGLRPLESASSSENGPAAAPMQYPPVAYDALRAAMDALDRARSALASDDVGRITAEGRMLADALHAIAAALPSGSPEQSRASDAAEASDRLANTKTLDDARKAFADVSNKVIALAAADPRLQQGWHVFECPMFEGHPRWLQHAPAPQNPYMGTKMPACGTESSWQAEASTTAAADSGEIDHYTCSMHPSVHQKTPGKCPICGMDLVPVTKEQQRQGVVTIPPARQQIIGVRTAQVIRAPMVQSFRAVGRLAYDESKLSDVNLKVRGWIVKLLVSNTGQRVQKGQTLFTLYSPELYNAQQDFLLATRSQSAVVPGGAPSHNEALAKAARQRLRLLDLSDAQIDEIAQRAEPLENVAFSAPASGFVIEKDVVEGASVEPGMRLYRIAALNKVWIEADVYEADFASVRVGQKASVTLDYLPGRTYEAKVTYVYPYLNPDTRTGRVRLELTNKGLELRPGMYASVQLQSDLGPRLQVPASAVVYTGPRRLVFVDLGEGRFRPQEVEVGVESNGMYEVRYGLREGDRVAASGVFLIAAEARIRTAAKYWDSTEVGEIGAAEPTPLPIQQGMEIPARRRPTSAPRMAPEASSPSEAQPQTYTCPMHPEVQSATPGKCPKCGMALVPVTPPRPK